MISPIVTFETRAGVTDPLLIGLQQVSPEGVVSNFNLTGATIEAHLRSLSGTVTTIQQGDKLSIGDAALGTVLLVTDALAIGAYRVWIKVTKAGVTLSFPAGQEFQVNIAAAF